ncbi:MAG: universal stress protein [Bacteroidetes bacterium]|nr:universal stress protein [Bacteroidota bacterium]
MNQKPIKTILCPTDFSEASEFGLDYAAHVAKLFFADIRLVYVRTSIWPEAIQLSQNAQESEEDISDRLSTFCRETAEEFGVNCAYQTLTTTNTVEEAIAEQAKECDMIVMGTNGANDNYQYLFGNNTFHVIQKTKCPVLVIPTGYLFKSIHTLVYAHHPDTNPIFLIDQLKTIIEPLNVAVKVVHVSEESPSTTTKHRLEILREAVMARKLKGKEWSFDSLYSQDVAWALDHYMKNHNGDILALSFHHRQLLEKLFTQDVVKQMTMIAEYPVLIFWH